ncbi:hypothetical protein FRB99_003892 [Tulasnella sp. 403]|nr:hypothetical protein FRB99_003892 [Tulasnella sp. 403]
MPPGADPFRQATPPPRPSSQPPAYTDKKEGGSGASTPSRSSLVPSIGAPPVVAGGPTRSDSSGMLSSLKSRLGAGIRSQPATQSTGGGGEETPPQDIERNIRTAINACRSENNSVLRNRQQMTHVKESLESGYCDVSARDGDFELIGNVHGYKFYMARDIPNPQQVAQGKQAAIGRFASIVVAPLQGVYKLPPSSLHIFYDTKGGLIAFNKGGGIFLNLRYYESWHDKDVQAGQSTVALISWYHSIAHEIAHNLVQPHNAEHEFYFSALCESHLVAFTRVLNGVLN